VLVVGDRDVVDQNVNAPETRHHLLNQRGHLVAARDIGDEQFGLSALSLDCRAHAFSARLVDVDHGHLCAFGCKQFGNFRPDISACARDDRHLILELHLVHPSVRGSIAPAVRRSTRAPSPLAAQHDKKRMRIKDLCDDGAPESH
jgi:hypothetical protein